MSASASAPRRAPGSRAAAAPGRSRTVRIAPLDGLRGLAVVAVLLFHAGHLEGGFLGVDLFFVLSGFLITGLLMEESTARGRIVLTAFWARRARRLLPALALVCVAAVLLAWTFGSPYVLRFALDDAPWAAAQAVNWHFIVEQIGYWNASGTRVFAHLWSIAVEWQFYLAWPVVVALAGRGRHGHRRGHRRVAALAGAGALVSLALMLRYGGAVDTTRAYEGTDTRAFSLLLGALAVTAPIRRLLARVPAPVADGVCAALACGIGAAWVLTGGQNAPCLFRGGLFAHSAACAALIGLLARNAGGRAGRLAGSAVPRTLGELSYGLYLWHWPVYLLLPRPVPGIGGWGRTAVAIGVSLLAAWVTKVLVEDPVRFRARWTTGRRGLLALTAAVTVAASVWGTVPRPDPGAGTVDVEQLITP
ncbi:acyltransferase family protein [Microbispora sp. CA-135349]|uniref:acyltransferase family protein n=1 Tax=Microbispora sp. CA-135349 TaxID=3239953 RepID=UPI003D8F867E